MDLPSGNLLIENCTFILDGTVDGFRWIYIDGSLHPLNSPSERES